MLLRSTVRFVASILHYSVIFTIRYIKPQWLRNVMFIVAAQVRRKLIQVVNGMLAGLVIELLRDKRGTLDRVNRIRLHSEMLAIVATCN